MKRIIAVILALATIALVGCSGVNGTLKDTEIFNKTLKADFIDGEFFDYTFDIKVDYEMFLGDNTKYNQDIAMFCAMLCNDLDTRWSTQIEGIEYADFLNKEIIYKQIGCKDIRIKDLADNKYEVDPCDTSRFALAHYPFVKDHVAYDVVIVTCAMTSSSNEWASSVDIGADCDAYYNIKGTDHPDWKNKNNHKGFDVTANRIAACVDSYIDEIKAKDKNNSNIILLINGYSRGAAAANIMADNYNKKNSENGYKIFAYTFSTPATVCTDADTVKGNENLFNFCTGEDLVAKVPLKNWGFKRYGNDFIYSLADTDDFKNLYGIDYLHLTERSYRHAELLYGTRNDIYEKEMVICEVGPDKRCDELTAYFKYGLYLQAKKEFGNQNLTHATEITCIDEENEYYGFTIYGNIGTLTRALEVILTNPESDGILSYLPFLEYAEYFLPLVSDLLGDIGIIKMETRKFQFPHLILSDIVSVYYGYAGEAFAK